MRFMVVGDLHLNEWPEFANLVKVGDTFWNSRLIEQVAVLEQIYLYSVKYQPEAIIFLGDIFHKFTSLTSFVFKSFLTLFKGIKSKPGIFILVGNHDYEDEARGIHYLENFKEEDIEVIDKPTYMIVAGKENALPFYFIPFIRKVDILNFYLDTFIENYSRLKNKVIGFGHIDIEGYQFNNYILSSGVSMKKFDFFRYFINGHYHNPNTSFEKILFSGAVMDFTFSDIGHNQKGVWMFRITDNIFKKKFLPLSYKKFIEVNSLDGLDTEKFYIRLLTDEIKERRLFNVRYEFKSEKVEKEFNQIIDYRKAILNYLKAFQGDKEKAKKYILNVMKEAVLK